jgi:probable DNA repair protein
VERTFSQMLSAGAFHISLGVALADHPIVYAALLLLELAAGRIESGKAGVLLRSPFVEGASLEGVDRALLDAKVRRDGLWTVTIEDLQNRANHCPVLVKRLAALGREAGRSPKSQSAGEWAQRFSRLLRSGGWPGERTLSSVEYQTVEAWKRLLSSFAGLDVTGRLFSVDDALARLQRLAAEVLFQPESEGAPVEIMGVLEAAGLEFGHLWVLGMHDQAFPGPPRPNPFLPLQLQRKNELPHSSPERELKYAKTVLARLQASAPEVVFSYPTHQEDRELEPSPLVGGDGAWTNPECTTEPAVVASFLEELIDETGPPLESETIQRGGVRMLKGMAECPFRAFAEFRLNAKPLEGPDLGLNPRDKGSVVHLAMALIWGELKTHAALAALSTVERDELIGKTVQQALEQGSPGKRVFHVLEATRLQKLLANWLEIERARSPFTVLQPEQDQMVNIGGVKLNTRIDRIDELPDGRQILIDYKTGQIDRTNWDGERPGEPQVPLYCATHAHPLAGAVFAQIHTGSLGFRGITETPLPELTNWAPGVSVQVRVEEWRRVLTRLAENFVSGMAQVDPVKKVCEYCHVTALCRIRELAPPAEDDLDDE